MGRGDLSLVLICLAMLVSAAVTRSWADEGDKSVLGGLLSRVLSTPSSRVAIGAVDGALSSDATIRDVAVSDRDGVWLKLDKARIVWRRLALLSGRLEVDSLEIGQIEMLRRPVPGPTPPEAKPDGKLLPDLPVKVEIKDFKLGELVLGEAVAGQPARLSAEGRPLPHDPRRRQCNLASITSLVFDDLGSGRPPRVVYSEPAGDLYPGVNQLPGS